MKKGQNKFFILFLYLLDFRITHRLNTNNSGLWMVGLYVNFHLIYTFTSEKI